MYMASKAQKKKSIQFSTYASYTTYNIDGVFEQNNNIKS